jgi:hypothetical protein
MTTAAQLRLLSDLKSIQQSPPEGVSASPLSDDNVRSPWSHAGSSRLVEHAVPSI